MLLRRDRTLVRAAGDGRRHRHRDRFDPVEPRLFLRARRRRRRARADPGRDHATPAGRRMSPEVHVAGPPVMVMMSGGVDSSVAAALLVEQGYAVTGVTLKLWGGESDSGCCSVSDVEDARRVAAQIGIPHYTFNFADDFTAAVVGPYVAAHAAGLTPNPCVECNRSIKFGRLLERAE